jgi:chromosome segregation ATPase
MALTADGRFFRCRVKICSCHIDDADTVEGQREGSKILVEAQVSDDPLLKKYKEDAEYKRKENEKQLEELKEANKKYKVDYEAMKAKLDDAEKNYNDLEKMTNKVCFELDQTLKYASDLEGEIEDLEEQLQIGKEEMINLQKELESVSKELETRWYYFLLLLQHPTFCTSIIYSKIFIFCF